MTHLLLFTAFVLWYAFHEASDDAHEIAEHREIDHVAQWLTRAAVFGSGWYLLWVLTAKPSTWPTLIGHAFLFSAVFRHRLNKRRGKHWAYVAPWSNVYDRLWFAVITWSWWTEEQMTRIRGWYLSIGCVNVHRAGRIAYAFELTVAAAATILMVV